MSPVYREHRPAPALTPWVACYWALRGHIAPSEDQERAVVPDACMDILFNLAPVPGSTASRVIGTMTRPLPVRESGAVDLLGVRFRPGGVPPFLRVPASEVTDDTIGLDDLWGRGADELTDRLRDATDTADRVRTLDQALLGRLSAFDPHDDGGLVLTAAGMAERAGGNLPVDALAHATGLGRRQLERRFLAAVGIPPKTACRVIRFQHALGRLQTRPGDPLSRVALDAGYHDQAHFTRDFKAFAGVTPGAWRRARTAVPDDAFVQDGDPADG